MTGGFLNAFKENFLRLRGQRIAADVLAKCVGQFTPEGLQAAIRDGWSVVDFLSKLSVGELKEFLLSVPSARSSVPSPNPSTLEESLDRITPEDIIAEIVKRLPEHGKVLQANSKWLAGELSKAKSFLG